MSVKRILVVCLVVALLYSSLNPLSEAFLANTETQQPEFSNTDSDLEMKIQLPGAVWEADSVVDWSPSDFDENRVMQFSVSLSNNIDIEDISQISVSLISLEGSASPSEEYTGIIGIDEFIQLDKHQIAYSLHTYPTAIPQGNYSASTTVTMMDATSMTANLEIRMQNYSLGLSYDDTPLGFCYEQSTIFELHYRNAGGPLTELEFQIALNTTFDEEWEEQIEIFDGNYDMMSASEESAYRIEIFVSSELDMSLLPESINITVISRYIDDDGVTQTLLDGDLLIQTYSGPCIGKIVPSISEIVDEQKVVAIDYSPSSNRFANAIAPFSNNSYNLRLELPNVAVQDASVLVNFSLDLDSSDFALIVKDQTNRDIVLRDYSFSDVISSQEQREYDFSLVIHDYPDSQIIQTEIEVYHLESASSITATVELLNPYYQTTLTAGDNLNILQNDSAAMILSIDRTKLSSYDRFDDNWVIDTRFRTTSDVSAGGLQFTKLINLDDNENFQDEEFNTEFNLSLELTISCPTDILPADYSLIISMINVPADRQSTIQFEVETIVTVIKNNSLSETEEPQNNATDNNSTGNNDSENNSQNQTLDLDSDKDGILDSQDLCPNTEEGEIVDEFGCRIVEDNSDDSDNTSGVVPPQDIQQQDSDAASSNSSENNVLTYLIAGLILVTLIGGVLVVRSKKIKHQGGISQTSGTKPISPLPVMPLPSVEPVVLQQWTDANGYSWRQMSDQTIMWWNGTDWIPYGKN